MIYGARNKTSNVLPVPEDEREGAGEGGCGLNCREHNLADVGAVVEPENPLHLIVRHVFHDIQHVLVEFPANSLKIRENKSFVHVESERDDIFGIFHG